MKKKFLFLNKFAAINRSEIFDLSSENYINLVKFFETGVMDRTHSLDSGFKYDIIDQIPEIASPRPNIDEIMLQKAQEILDLAKERNQKILVLWSGGIDSTAALLALLELCGEDSPDIITLGSSHGSFVEFPEFGSYLIEQKFKILPMVHPVSKHLPKDYIVVTGEHGDQLFGSDKMLPLVDAGLGDMSYKKYLPLFMAEKLGDTKQVNDLMEYLEPVIMKCPFVITDICQCLWWLNYVLKWQQVSLRIPVWSGKSVKPIFNQCQHFYRGEIFQQWSLAYENKNPQKIDKYKLELKEFINERFECENYFLRKTKEISLRPRAEKKWWELARHRWSFVLDATWNLEKQIIPHYL
ncbi:MAG: hypothetical protein ACJ0IZ_02550 [Verrucomicrobiales bacterium]